MVADDPESFADLDGHQQNGTRACNANQEKCGTPARDAASGQQPATAQQTQSPKAAHKGITLGLQVGGTIVAGVGKAAAGATGSVNPVSAQYDAETGKFNVAASASGGALAKAGKRVAGSPEQNQSNTVVGAFGGVEAGALVSNAGNSKALKQPSETISVDFGLGLGGAFNVTLSHGDIIDVNVGLAYGFGAAYSDINTGTVAAGTDRQ